MADVTATVLALQNARVGPDGEGFPQSPIRFFSPLEFRIAQLRRLLAGVHGLLFRTLGGHALAGGVAGKLK